MTSRYQLTKTRAEGIIKELEFGLEPTSSMLNRIKVAKLVKEWFGTDNDRIIRRRAIDHINRYGLAKNMDALLKCILVQMKMIEHISNDEEQRFQLQLLKQRVKILACEFMYAKTDNEMQEVFLNCGFGNLHKKEVKKINESVKPQKPIKGIEFSNLRKRYTFSK